MTNGGNISGQPSRPGMARGHYRWAPASRRWHIFNNFEERPGSGFVPNSFFAIRTRQGNSTVVRALQTAPVGPFEPMQSLKFRCAFPFAWYDLADGKLPVSVSLEAYSFLIPMDLKSSAISSAVFRYTVKNTGSLAVQVSLPATQQNAVGFNLKTAVTMAIRRYFYHGLTD